MTQAESPDTADIRAAFLERLARFLVDVRSWLAADPDIVVAERRHVIHDPLGHYDAPGLEVIRDGNSIASIVPIAGVVLGAQGRVDVTGALDEAPVVYLISPGRMEMQVAGAVTHVRPLFRGVTEPGWYWITTAASREVRYVDASTFRAIVVAVSDYELTPLL